MVRSLSEVVHLVAADAVVAFIGGVLSERIEMNLRARPRPARVASHGQLRPILGVPSELDPSGPMPEVPGHPFSARTR